MSDKRFVRVTAVAVALGFAFTLVLLFNPEAVGVTAHGYSMAYADSVFDRNEMMTVEISIPEDTWQELLDNAQLEQYVSCDVTINGNACYSVGIRCKGNSSLSMVGDSQRYSFKLKFDEYVKNQTLLGLDKMALNNTQADATWMKEYMAYYTMDMVGVDVPLYAFAKVYVNGEFWGLYLGLEVMEESYALHNYGTDYGNLYKVENMDGGRERDFMVNLGEDSAANRELFEQFAQGNWPDMENMPDMGGMPDFGNMPDMGNMTAFPQGENPFAFGENGDDPTGNARGGGFGGMFAGGNGSDMLYIDDEISSYSAIFDKTSLSTTTDTDKKRVIAALKGISDTTTDISDYVDVDQMLRYIAGNAAVGNGDGYFGSMMHNYYIYEKDGKITMLPWDYNLAYGGFAGNASQLINLSIDAPVTSGSMEDRPILSRLLENQEYLEIYYGYIQTIGEFYKDGGAAALVDSLNEMIREWVELDPTKQYTIEQYDAAVQMLKQYLALRGESMVNQVNGDDTAIDASAINLSTMGSQGGGGGMGGGMGGDRANRGGNMRGNGNPPAGGGANAQGQEQAIATQAEPQANPQAQQWQRPQASVAETAPQEEDTGGALTLAIAAGTLLLGVLFAAFFRRRRFSA